MSNYQQISNAMCSIYFLLNEYHIENRFIMIKVTSIHYNLMNQILDNIRNKSDDSTNVQFGSFTVSLIIDLG